MTLNAPLRTISHLSRASGVTPRAIRFYESVGLINSLRDLQNVRWFDEVNSRRLAVIVALRRAGLSVQEVGRILDRSANNKERQADVASRLLVKRLESLELQMAAVSQTLANVSDLLPSAITRGEIVA